jgi:hypothetical protein
MWADRPESAQVDRDERAPRRHVAALELITGFALVLSTVVAMAVVSIGIARADTLVHWQPDGSSLALVVAAVLAVFGFGGVTLWLSHARRARD